VKVKTKIVFEIEYPLNMEFYVPDSEDASLAMERNVIADNPKAVIDAFWDHGTIATNVKRVADNG
jgi:hypothetical protein